LATEECSVQAVQHAQAATAKATTPAVGARPRPRPSDRRSQEQRRVRNHERLVAAWLRSLSTR